jgi:hypothetical protein
LSALAALRDAIDEWFFHVAARNSLTTQPDMR